MGLFNNPVGLVNKSPEKKREFPGEIHVFAAFKTRTPSGGQFC
jgi:hypothetical protein